MVVNEFWILLLGVNNENLGIRLEKNICLKKKEFGWNRRGSYYKQEEWLETLLDENSAFSDGSESDDSNNDDEDCNENIEAFVRRCPSK